MSNPKFERLIVNDKSVKHLLLYSYDVRVLGVFHRKPYRLLIPRCKFNGPYHLARKVFVSLLRFWNKFHILNFYLGLCCHRYVVSNLNGNLFFTVVFKLRFVCKPFALVFSDKTSLLGVLSHAFMGNFYCPYCPKCKFKLLSTNPMGVSNIFVPTNSLPWKTETFPGRKR